MTEWLSSRIRTIPDYPKKGIMFRDLTTLFQDAAGFRRAVDSLVLPYTGVQIDKVVAIEARGFILGGAVAHQLSAGFVPIRKMNKLPYDAIAPGEKVLVVDDLIATGGTAMAAIELVRQAGGDVVGACFVVDLPDLGGTALLNNAGVPAVALIHYPGH